MKPARSVGASDPADRLDPLDRLIVAIDETEPSVANAVASQLAGQVRWLKVGMTLYYRGGAELVRAWVHDGWRVFLDLKCHDIPHQVAGAVAVLGDLGAELVTVHTAGGFPMLEAAARAAEATGIEVLGVTVLTSLDRRELTRTGIDAEPADLAMRRAELARDAGLGGVVASPQDAARIRARLPGALEIITPGIRPAGSGLDDQRRVATPGRAIRAGATRLVVGRPITRAADPAAAARAILATIRGAAGGS